MAARTTRTLATLAVTGAGAFLTMGVLAGPADALDSPPAPALTQGQPNYPKATHYSYAPVTVDPPAPQPPVAGPNGLDATSVGLGVLGGLAASATGLGLNRAVKHRRRGTAAHAR